MQRIRKSIIITDEAVAAIRDALGPGVVNTERLPDGTHRVYVTDEAFSELHADKHPHETISDLVIREIARLANRLH